VPPIRSTGPVPAWLCHPALTGLPAQEWDSLIAALMSLHDQQRETSLDKRRGHRPRLAAPGTGRRPVLTLADRLLATALHQRLGLPQVAIAVLFAVRPETNRVGGGVAPPPPTPPDMRARIRRFVKPSD